MATRAAVLEQLTDDELRGQLELVFWEHKRIPDHRRGDRQSEYRSVMNWYSSVCEEYRRRNQAELLNELVRQYRERSRVNAVSQDENGKSNTNHDAGRSSDRIRVVEKGQ